MKYILLLLLVAISFSETFYFQVYLENNHLSYYSNKESDWDSLKTLGDTPNLLLADTTHQITISKIREIFGIDTFYISDTVELSPIVKRVVDEVPTEYGIIAAIYRYFNKFSTQPDSVKVYKAYSESDTVEVKTEIFY